MSNLLEKIKNLNEQDKRDGKSPGERLSIKVAELMEANEKLRKENEKLKGFLVEAVEEWEYSLCKKSELLITIHKDHERIAKIKRVLKIKEKDA